VVAGPFGHGFAGAKPTRQGAFNGVKGRCTVDFSARVASFLRDPLGPEPPDLRRRLKLRRSERIGGSCERKISWPKAVNRLLQIFGNESKIANGWGWAATTSQILALAVRPETSLDYPCGRSVRPLESAPWLMVDLDSPVLRDANLFRR
jgi:hypothetical protein